eukprot:TRINITY_DN9449_c0_g1_i1.p1 TRINITY_DN9449_c0_g1~~TRINITY_DN9449_c0_g1_i1.p1  ORF type:complete len:327 (-),score=52.59 TRINITY_DN9449_c0_g1_i1:1077-2057(-)
MGAQSKRLLALQNFTQIGCRSYSSSRDWSRAEVQREFINRAAGILHIQHWKDWYRVSKKSLKEIEGGNEVLQQFDGSLLKVLLHVFPQYAWNRDRFVERVSRHHWNGLSNQRKFFDSLAKNLHIKRTEDWCSVRREDFKKHGGAGLLKHYGDSLEAALAIVYPEFDWIKLKAISGLTGMSKPQSRLYSIMQELFPNEVIQSEVQLSRSKKRRPFEFDVFIPSKNLALEYQGEHHFGDSHPFGDAEEQQKRDAEKRAMCERNGITLIEVPYWWDGTKEEIQATIHLHRSDLLETADCKPISSTPPRNHRKRESHVGRKSPGFKAKRR